MSPSPLPSPTLSPAPGLRRLPREPASTPRQLYSSPDGAFSAGLWTGEIAQREIHYQMDELCCLIAGQVRVTDAAGHAETFGPGDVFVIPAGFSGLWETLEPAQKIYAIYRPAAAA